MKDMSVLQQSPFTDKGSVADLFGNDIQTWMEIKSVILIIMRIIISVNYMAL